MTEPDGGENIRGWYDLKREERRVAWANLQAAKARGASREELRRLECAYQCASYVGD